MNKDGYFEVSNAYITGLINKLDAERVKVEQLKAKLKESNNKVERLKELLGDASKALDLAQSLLERSAHHARILGTYERTRAALDGKEDI